MSPNGLCIIGIRIKVQYYASKDNKTKDSFIYRVDCEKLVR